MWLVFICRLRYPQESQEGETALDGLSMWAMLWSMPSLGPLMGIFPGK